MRVISSPCPRKARDQPFLGVGKLWGESGENRMGISALRPPQRARRASCSAPLTEPADPAAHHRQ